MSDNDYPSLTARLVDAVRKGRERGLGWAVTRMREELVTPTSTPGSALRNLLAAIERGIRARTPDAASQNTLHYFYDLEIAPITYDFASYLALAEMERRKRGLNKLHIVIVPGRRLEREFDDYQHIVTPQMRQARIMDMLAPLAKLLPSCIDLTICASKSEAASLRFASAAHIWPNGYSPTFPVSPHHRLVRDRARQGEAVFPVFTAPREAMETVQQTLAPQLEGALPVVITLREYGYNPARNSNIEAWGAFARGLDKTQHRAVFIRDTQTASDPIPQALDGQIIYTPASYDPVLRMAAYELAYMNLAVMHGPMELCWYNQACTYGLFLEAGTAPQNTEEAMINQGFNLHGDLPFATARQHWYWQGDTHDTIAHAFDDMVTRIEKNPPETEMQAGHKHD
ncbi:hypothetical protein NBRC116588_10640 [Pyruvatibacter sp. HU-CL02332]|uniref:hypothetical protein n=1 Tax=Pyruvatibacter sp. HU-CL02332 TaxID=3127650 RepID=UPI0031096984